MIEFNKTTNKIEKVISDPNVSEDGYVWFNIIDKSFKIKSDGKIKKIVTVDDSFDGDLKSYLNSILNEYEVVIEVENLKEIEINHGLGVKEFLYSVFDSETNSYVIASADVENENIIKFNFVDTLNGKIYIKFNIQADK